MVAMALGSRVVVVGTSGSGKTTLAQRLATVLDVPHVELDALQHGPNWEQATETELRDRAAAATAGKEWVVDGNYSAVRDVVWPRASAIVWLDYERGVVMRRVLWRSFERAVCRRPLWNDNRERWRTWADREHPIRWAWSTHADRRARFAALVDDRWIRLRSPAETRRWLDSLGYRSSRSPRARSSSRSSGGTRSPNVS
jgi:adenylate kinase family enzyme